MKRKIKNIGLSILAALCFFSASAFAGCKTEDLSSLYALANPQQCVYECESASLGGKDLLCEFKTITLELKRDGAFLLMAKPKFGPSLSQEGKYDFDENERTITMTAVHGKKTYKKTVKLEKGSFTLSQSLGGRELIMKFTVKA